MKISSLFNIVQKSAEFIDKLKPETDDSQNQNTKKSDNSNSSEQANTDNKSFAQENCPTDTSDTVIDGELEEDSDVYEPGSFEHSSNKLSTALADAAANGFKDPETVVKALGALAEVAKDTMKYVADQTTKQEEIRAKRDIAISQINATSELIKTYLDKTFDERKEIFSKQFKVVDEAIRTGNTEMLSIGLHNINSLAAQSPFKALSDIEQVKKALNSEDTVWDI